MRSVLLGAALLTPASRATAETIREPAMLEAPDDLARRRGMLRLIRDMRGLHRADARRALPDPTAQLGVARDPGARYPTTGADQAQWPLVRDSSGPSQA